MLRQSGRYSSPGLQSRARGLRRLGQIAQIQDDRSDAAGGKLQRKPVSGQVKSAAAHGASPPVASPAAAPVGQASDAEQLAVSLHQADRIVAKRQGGRGIEAEAQARQIDGPDPGENGVHLVLGMNHQARAVRVGGLEQ